MVIKSDMELKVAELQAWIKTQPHLPQGIQTLLLKRFLYSMFCDVEGAKRLIELNYTLRNKHPQIFMNRDPNDASVQQLLQVADLVPLPGLTPEKNKLLFYRLLDTDADKFDFTAAIKTFFMIADCRFIVEDEADICKGEIPIYDMNGYSLRHLAKTVFSSLRVYMKFVQEAHPVCLKEIHVLNCPSYVDKVMAVVKPFIKSEVFKLIHFHLPNADTPFKYFPREMLPEEYGGKAGKMCDLKAQWKQVLMEQRDFLLDNNQWVMDKTKKPSAADMANLNQHFKTLDID